MTGSIEKEEMSMSSKPNSNESTESPDGKSAHEEIRVRAYEIYIERGGQPGGEMDDWLQAERELEGSMR
jgi:hypothetical protein